MKRARQEKLTRVGPRTPMGELLRRYWFPVAASVELPAGAALKVRLLGEDLVAFRTSDGALGLLDERCTHRGTSLACGIVDGHGIACPYHGWRFAPDGRCLTMPFEARAGAPAAALLARARTRAHPIEELGGLVFAYLGPQPAPLLPRYDVFVWPNALRDIGRALLPCNFLQIMENSVDPVHVEHLHGHHLTAVRARAGLPAPAHYRRRHQAIGFDRFAHGILKRRVLEGGSEADEDWRVGHPLVFPTMVRVGARGQHRLQIRVPVDDTSTLHLWYACYRAPPGRSAPPQTAVPIYDVPWRDEYGKFITDFVDGGDIMAWVSQGPIADRTRELLVSSDRGLKVLRRLYLEQIQRVKDGHDPLGVVRQPSPDGIIALPQENDKFGGGDAFVREALALSHCRHSPILDQIAALLGPDLP
ncbi:MAG: Rieske 2Fe-2S domain-containing protein [Myxococcota bacterium]